MSQQCSRFLPQTVNRALVVFAQISILCTDAVTTWPVTL